MKAGERDVERREQVQDVAIFRVRETSNPTDTRANRQQTTSAELLLNPVLNLIRKLGSSEREKLNAVIRGLVVRRRNHDTEISANIADEERCRRSRENARVEHIDTRTREPRRYGSRQEIAGNARIARYYRSRFATGCTDLFSVTTARQHLRRRLGEAQCEIGREIAVGKPTDSIGPKETRHRIFAD